MTDSLPPECQNPHELLFRQVHPQFVQDGQPTSEAFGPNRSDDGLMSVNRGSIVDAAESFRRHTLTLQAVGTWAVNVGECVGQALVVSPDPEPDNDAHAVVDFRQLGTSAVEKKRKKLKAYALARGQLHPRVDSHAIE